MARIENADAPNRPVSDPKPLHVGPRCRCLPCCCHDGQGHKHPDWIAWEERQRGRGGSASAERD